MVPTYRQISAARYEEGEDGTPGVVAVEKEEEDAEKVRARRSRQMLKRAPQLVRMTAFFLPQ